MSPDAVVKVGGSLLSAGMTRSLVEALSEVALAHPLVVVPGGGPFADAVRQVSKRHGPGDSASHWMAILAMDQHAHLLAAMSSRAELCIAPEQCLRIRDARRLVVLAPYAWLRAADPLPHDWQVTSDSLAAWVAARLGARRLVLLKARDGLKNGRELRDEAGVADAAEAGIVDAYLPQALEPSVECWILNGHRPARLRELLDTGRARGTRLQPR